MLNHQQRFAVVANAQQQFAKGHLLGGVHSGRRFIQRQQAWFGGQRAGNLQPPLVTIGEVAGAIVGELRDAGIVQQVPGQLAGLRLLGPGPFMTGERGPQAVAGADVAAHHNVLQYRHVVKQPYVLEGAGDARGGHFLNIVRKIGFPADSELAAVRRVKPGNQVKAGGFPCAVGADQAVDFTLINAQRYVVDRRQTTETLRHMAYA